jgi:hypothetical protein
LSIDWLAGKQAKYDQQKHRWYFPSGATLSFGHAGNLATLIQDYQGTSFGYIGIDELTQWPLAMYRFLSGRCVPRRTCRSRYGCDPAPTPAARA